MHKFCIDNKIIKLKIKIVCFHGLIKKKILERIKGKRYCIYKDKNIYNSFILHLFFIIIIHYFSL